MNWFFFAFLGAVTVAISFFLRKAILLKHNVRSLLFYMYSGTITSAFFLLLILWNKEKKNILSYENKIKILAFISGAILPVAVYLNNSSLKLVSNPAYTSITFAVFKTLILLSLSIYLLNLPYNKMTLLGVAFALTGVVLIILNE